MSRLKTLAKETAIYGISSILGRMLNWLLVPLYTQYLVPAAYGIVTELYAYVAFLVILYTYGMETAYFRFATKRDRPDPGIFNLAQSSILFTSIIISAIIIIFSTPIVNFLEYPGRERYIVWFAFILGIDAITAIPFARLRLENKAKRFAIVKLINILLNVGLNLFFIIYCTYVVQQDGNSAIKVIVNRFFNENSLVDYIFISNLIANGFVLILLSDIILKIKPAFNKYILFKMYRYAFPIMVMGLAGVTNEMLSRAVLKRWLPEGFYPQHSNQGALGIFGAAYKLAVFMTLAIQAFRYAAEPFFFSRSGDLDSKELFSKVMHWFIIFATVMLLVISLNLDIIGHFFLRSPSYREGLVVVPVLLLANLFLGIYYNLSVWFKLTDKTYFGTIISIGGAIITVLMNYILIPVLGYLGSSLATLTCYISMAVLSYIMGKNRYPVPYQVKRGVFYIILAALFTYIGYYVFPNLLSMYKLYQGILLVIFIGIIILADRRQIRQFISVIRNK